MATVGGCVVVLCVWAVLGAVLTGVGRAVRRAVSGPLLVGSVGDFWTGLVVVLASALLAHLVGPVRLWWWAPLVVVAVVGWRLSPRPRSPRQWSSTHASWGLAIVLGAAAVGLAALCVGPSTNYDTGLYHAQAITWYHDYAAVPGLGNFHARLGYNSGVIMLQALVGVLLPAGLSQHVVNGVLVGALLLELVLALAALGLRRGAAPSSLPLVLLLVTLPALRAVDRAYDLASTSIDLSALVATVAAAVYVARVVVAPRWDAAVVVPSACLLVLLPVLRVQLLVFSAVAAVGLLIVLARRCRGGEGSPRVLYRMTAGAVVVLAVWMAHGVVLTGYPLFPSTVGGLPVSWRVPGEAVAQERRSITAWARWPREPTDRVLAGSQWVHDWVDRMSSNPWVLSMLIVLVVGLLLWGWTTWTTSGTGRTQTSAVAVATFAAATLVLVLVVNVASRPGAESLFVAAGVTLVATSSLVVASGVRRRADRDAQALLVVALATSASCAAWFLTAPDPRFAWGSLWLAVWLPAAVGLVRLVDRDVRVFWIVASVLLVAALVPMQAEDPSPVAEPSGTAWGLSLTRQGVTQVVRSRGLVYEVPVDGDQCWRTVRPCVPTADGPWRLRSPGDLQAGFRAGPPSQQARQ